MMVGCAATARAEMLLNSRTEEIKNRYAGRYLRRGRELLKADHEETDSFKIKPEEPLEDTKGKQQQLWKNEFGELSAECGIKGVFGGLWRLAEMAGCGLCIDQQKIPVLQFAIELCELADESVYEADSTGVKLFLTRNADEAAERMGRLGIHAYEIGYTTDTKDRIVKNGDIIRYLTPDER